MRSEGRLLVAALSLGLGCQSEAPWTTVELALSAVPERVRSLTVTVVELERGQVVATATAGPDTQLFALGVPAEVPLELRAVARTDRPGPPSLGGVMPAYVARALRTVRLGREQQRIGLVAEPAGVMSFTFERRLRDPVRLRFRSRDTEATIAEVPVAAGRVGVVSVVLPTGPMTAELGYEEGVDPLEEPLLRGGAGLYVARETESVAVFDVVEPLDPLPPEAVRSLELELETDRGPVPPSGPIVTSSAGPERVRITVYGRNAAGQRVRANTPVDLKIIFPGLDDPPQQDQGLPGRFERSFSGVGRVRIEAQVLVEDREPIRAELELNHLPVTRTPGPAERLELEVDHPDELGGGARLRLRALDRAGLLAAPGGLIDLSRSDPWVIFPDGLTIGAGAEAVPRPRVIRSSGPLGVPVSIRATITATVGLTIGSTLTLPLLDLPAGR